MANEFYVRSILHGQVSLAAINEIRVVHEAMNGCKSKDSLKDCFENLNISLIFTEISRTSSDFCYCEKIS